MNALAPLETLYESSQGAMLSLPPELEAVYGPFRLRSHPNRPMVLGNFVTTLDGVVALDRTGRGGGGQISGYNQHDKMVMGMLRALADAVVVGAGTLRSVPNHLWIPEHVYPPMAEAYRRLRASLHKPELPLNVIVTARGEINPALPVFSGEVPTLIVTTAQGAQEVSRHRLPPPVRLEAVPGDGPMSARDVLRAVDQSPQSDVEVVLVEGGPHLIGDFFAEQLLDELFLTLSPQVAGRDEMLDRPGLVAGRKFAPEQPLWGTLMATKRAGSHLFLRYSFSEMPQLSGSNG